MCKLLLLPLEGLTKHVLLFVVAYAVNGQPFFLHLVMAFATAL